DIQNMHLRDSFHCADLLQYTSDKVSAMTFKQRVQHRIAGENRLSVAPALFEALKSLLPRVTHTEIHATRGRYKHEATRLHATLSYDAILHIGQQVQAAPVAKWIEWDQKLSPDELRRSLKSETPESLGVRNIPIARLKHQLRMLDLLLTNPPATVGELKQ